MKIITACIFYVALIAILVFFVSIDNVNLSNVIIFIFEFNYIDDLLYTTSAVLFGLIISIIVSFVITCIIDYFSVTKYIFLPIIYFLQIIPLTAISPIILIIFGFDYFSKIIFIVLFSFYSISINLLSGLSNISETDINCFKNYNASKSQIFFKLKVPLSLSYFWNGIKISVTYIYGVAIMGELLGGGEGLGNSILRYKRAYEYNNVFAICIIIMIINIILIIIAILIPKLFFKKYYYRYMK